MVGKNRCLYNETFQKFCSEDEKTILGFLVNSYHGDLPTTSIDAWVGEIEIMKQVLNKFKEDKGQIVFEYDIPRLGKRIDVILLIRHMVFSLEFKNGKDVFTAQDARQAEDYALDIKNFHKESEDLYVCPILVATDANPYPKEQSCDCYPDKQVHLQRENIETLIPKVGKLAAQYGSDEDLDFETWFNSPYYPTPTIIAAAIEAYSSHNLSEIARSEAGQEDIDKCEAKLTEIIKEAKQKKKKCVCFVTGVPGAGKTLVGLDVVAKSLNDTMRGSCVYISGNGPLVEVLQHALKKSAKAKQLLSVTSGEKKEREAFLNKSIEALIQSSYGFKKDNAHNVAPTVENILIFDEAQRVWNEKKMAYKHNNDPDMSVSEPKLMYRIMDRHNDWAVMVCLVGMGQDIYDGEVGIYEWFRCGIEDFLDWELYYSPQLFERAGKEDIDKHAIEHCSRCHPVNELHLKTDIRSFKAEKRSAFVDSLLNNEPEQAKQIYDLIKGKYPLYLTRDIKLAKAWVRKQVRGNERSGILACSSAQRLKPEGIYVPTNIDVKNWFLAPSEDLRSSNMLEVVASEFKVQGLEIDWAVVCWDADLRRSTNGKDWAYHSFRGTAWNKRNQPEQQRYLLNSYRVLLTRARQGMILFVPKGVDPEEDSTRDHEFYDAIYKYLLSCGIEELKKQSN